MIRRSIPAVVFATCILNTAHASESATPVDADSALALLKEGNARFVHGESTFPNLDQDRRCDTTDNGQHPYASILSCADSRVPPELVFDAGIGELFTIRVAGNVADTDEIGTLEYGAGHLHTPLIVVMGHTKCGAVTAVVQNAEVHGSLPKLVDNIVPAVEATREQYAGVAEPKFIQLAIKQNVRQAMSDVLRNSEEIRGLVAAGKVTLVGAVYDIHNGTIEWLGELPNQSALLDGATAEHGGVLLHQDGTNVKQVSGSGHNENAHASTGDDNPAKGVHAANDETTEPQAVKASLHAEPQKTTLSSTDDDHVAPNSKKAESAPPGDSHQGENSPGGHQSKLAHDKRGSDASEADEPHADAHSPVEPSQSMAQKHGLLVPGMFLAAGSVLSGTVVFLLKSKGGQAAKPAKVKAANEGKGAH